MPRGRPAYVDDFNELGLSRRGGGLIDDGNLRADRSRRGQFEREFGARVRIQRSLKSREQRIGQLNRIGCVPDGVSDSVRLVGQFRVHLAGRNGRAAELEFVRGGDQKHRDGTGQYQPCYAEDPLLDVSFQWID